MPAREYSLDGTWKLVDTEHAKGDPTSFFKTESNALAWIPVSVPGDVHVALEESNRIGNPFWGLNQQDCDWIALQDWWYQTTFVSPDISEKERLHLVLDGVDTYSTIFVNGHEIGRTNNMFLQYKFDVTPFLNKDAENVLVICVQSPYPYIESKLVEHYSAAFYVPRIFARKAQYQFSWDWAPNLPAMGIWRSVRLVQSEPGVLTDVFLQTWQDGKVLVHIDTDLRNAVEDGVHHFEVEILDQDNKRVAHKIGPLMGIRSFAHMKVANPNLWWPNGYGTPYRYRYRVRLLEDDTELDVREGFFGIREVNRIEPQHANGTMGCGFEINGVEVFCQGANWVPLDCFPGTVADDRYAHHIRLVREAGLNMLRVWGGGIYEKDCFYDLCDAAGIMVFQDLMFACSDVPDDDPDFVMSVIPEFEYQVRRLRNHPCIVHWSGGNEIIGSLGTLAQYGDKIARYIGRGVVQELIPDASYAPVSPFGYTGVQSHPSSGMTHGYCYERCYHDGADQFRRIIQDQWAAFQAEFGMCGPCRMRSIRKFIPENDLWPLNDTWEAHVHDNPYNGIPLTFVQLQHECATQVFKEPHTVEEFVKMAGIFQMEFLTQEFEQYRYAFPLCRGALYWMLNDCWPCASWASIDYYGEAKPIYYGIKRATAPVTLRVEESSLNYTWKISNFADTSVAGTLQVYLEDVHGQQNLLTELKCNISEHSNECIGTMNCSEIPDIQDGFFRLIFRPENGSDLPVEKIYFHRLWKDIHWPEPGLHCSIECCEAMQDGEYQTTLKLTTERYARCVFLSMRDDVIATWSDNYFDMPAGDVRRILIYTSTPVESTDAIIVNHWLTEWIE